MSNREQHASRITRTEQGIRLNLLEEDIHSVQIALEGYLSAISSLHNLFEETPSVDKAQVLRRQMFYHAKNFVCGMRRVGRLLEDLSANRSIFPQPVADTIQLAWRKRRTMFNKYTDPRNAIEHIDGELKGRTNWVILNLDFGNHVLSVTEDEKKRAYISEENLQRAFDALEEIKEAISRHETQQ